MADRIVRKYTVTITKEITVDLPATYGEADFIKEWQSSLWPIESVEDIAQHAAEMAAKGFSGYSLDGLGLLGPHYSTYPKVPDVKFTEHSEDVEVEPTTPEGSEHG